VVEPIQSELRVLSKGLELLSLLITLQHVCTFTSSNNYDTRDPVNTPSNIITHTNYEVLVVILLSTSDPMLPDFVACRSVILCALAAWLAGKTHFSHVQFTLKVCCSYPKLRNSDLDH
jgi:hypothetical protein